MKTCTRCRVDQPLANFYARLNGHIDSWCKPCKAEYIREYRIRKPRDAADWRNKSLLKRYGLTPADYDRMFAEQAGECAICGKPEAVTEGSSPYARRYGRLHVDHDKDTGEVRGLLCGRCNRGIGMFLHRPELLAGAIEYLSVRVSSGGKP